MRQIIDDNSDIVGVADMQAEAEVLVSPVDSIGARQEQLLLNTTCELSPTQYFPGSTTHFLSNLSRDPSLYEMGNELVFIKMYEEVARGDLYNACGRYTLYRLWKSRWNLAEACDLALLGWSWYFLQQNGLDRAW